jgi:hypothetical protein
MANFHVPDYLILPYGHAKKSDLQKIGLSAVSADGLYFSTDVPVIFINKSEHKPLCLPDFEKHFQQFPDELFDKNDEAILEYILTSLKSHNPDMTPSEELFLDLYFKTLTALAVESSKTKDKYETFTQIFDQIGLHWAEIEHWYKSANDVWRALLPIPELQLYVQDPLATTQSYQPDNNFRVDYGFWDGEKLIAVEIDGAEPAGYARDSARPPFAQGRC